MEKNARQSNGNQDHKPDKINLTVFLEKGLASIHSEFFMSLLDIHFRETFGEDPFWFKVINQSNRNILNKQHKSVKKKSSTMQLSSWN